MVTRKIENCGLENKKIEKDEYRASKRALIDEEHDNFDKIMMLKCAGEGDWFEIAEHSALIYYHYVVLALKIKNIKFTDDYDSFYEQYKIGRIRVRGVETTKARIQKVLEVSGQYEAGNKVIFILKHKFTPEKIENLKKKETKRRMDLNRTIDIDHSSPLFYRNLIDVMRILHHDCLSKLDKLSSQTNGARMVEIADTAMIDYIHSTELPKNMREERVEKWKSIRTKMHKLKYEIQVMDVAGLWSAEKCLNLFEKIIELKQIADKELYAALEEVKRKDG